MTRHMALRGFRIKDVPGDNNCQFLPFCFRARARGYSNLCHFFIFCFCFKDTRSRLTRHMVLRGLRIKDVPGDNNCLNTPTEMVTTPTTSRFLFSFRMRARG